MSENGATQRRVLRLDPRDNALVALADLRKGEAVKFAGREYVLLSDVPAKHKFVTGDVPAGGDVIMYGVLVGRTAEPLRRGDLLQKPAPDLRVRGILIWWDHELRRHNVLRLKPETFVDHVNEALNQQSG